MYGLIHPNPKMQVPLDQIKEGIEDHISPHGWSGFIVDGVLFDQGDRTENFIDATIHRIVTRIIRQGEK